MKYLKLFVAVSTYISTFPILLAQVNGNLEHSVLWKIEHTALEKPSYIFGTLHVMCEDDFLMPEKVTKALQEVDALVLEVNLFDTKEIQAFQQSISKSKKISEELSKEQYDELDKLVIEITKMPLSTYDMHGLFILNSILITKMLPCSQIKSVENELALLANENKKPIYSLEKAVQQIEIMRKAYPGDFAFKQMILYKSYKQDFNDAITAYKNEDISSAIALITKPEYMDENATTLLQINRNKDWTDKMPTMMEKRSSLFAVGAAHLTSDFGIIHLLRKEGYTVTPVLN